MTGTAHLPIAGETGMQDRAAVGPPPYTNAEPEWPTYGYDGTLGNAGHPDWRNSGRTRAEWMSIANTMVDRWLAWRVWCQNAPDSYFLPTRQP